MAKRIARGTAPKAKASADGIDFASPADMKISERMGLCRPFTSSVPAPLLVLDAAGRVLSASEAVSDILGRPLSEIIGATIGALLGADAKDASCTPAFFAEAIKKSNISTCTAAMKGADGEMREIEITAKRFAGDAERLLFVSLRDVTSVESAERDFKECDEKYRALFQNLNRGIAIYEAIDEGKDFIIKDFNHPAELMERVKRDDIVGKPVTKVFPGVEELGLLDVLRRVWKTGKAEHHAPAVYEDKRLGRSWRKNDVFKLSTGEVVSVYVDVTDRMETLRKLEESEVRYRALFENMRSGVAVYEAIDEGKDFIIKEFNEAAERSDKVKRKEIIGKPVTKVFPGADKIGFMDVLRRVWTKGKPEYFPPTLYKDSRIGTVWWEDYVYKLPTGELVATFENVTEKMKAGEDLRKSVAQVIAERDKIDTIVQSIADAVFVVDKEDKIILFNEAAADITGVAAAEAIGKKCDDIFSFVSGEPEKRADAFIRAAHETGVPASASGDVVLVSKDGRRIPVSPSASPLKSAEGVAGAVVVFRDVTAEREADKVKAEFASITSRQIRTPLADIRWYLDLLLKGKAGEVPMKAKEHIEQINAMNERMIRITDELLAVTKRETGPGAAKTTDSVDVTEILRGVINENIDLIRGNRVSVELCEALPKKLYLRVDPKAIRAIFRHLVSNALKYSKPSGKVEICFDGSRKDALLFSIKDYGYGIPARQQSRVFERFFRADNVLTKFPEGTGLGLAGAKSTVEALGGKIWYTSIENVGTTFYFTLPKMMLPGKRVRGQTERSETFEKPETARQEGWADAD